MPALIRPGRRQDAPQIARLANLLVQNEGISDDLFSAEQILRDGFGERPAFQVLIADLRGESVGYALFTDGYNTDIPARAIWLEDLFVDEPARGRGIGRRLLAAVARIAMDRGARSVWWGVRSSNHRARAFYARVGATDDDARILELNNEKLTALAAEHPPEEGLGRED